MTCPNCLQPLRPHYRIHYEQYELEYGDGLTKTCLRETSREQVGWGWDGKGMFCSTHCGYEYGCKQVTKAQ